MKAAIFTGVTENGAKHLEIADVPRPDVQPGHLLLKVLACGVCRTDLHIAEGDLPPLRLHLIPGPQIVGEVIQGATEDLPQGTRVGVFWMGGTDGDCWFCKPRAENAPAAGSLLVSFSAVGSELALQHEAVERLSVSLRRSTGRPGF